MKDTYTFIVYVKETPKRFNGILGEIDFYAIHMLLLGGKYIIDEVYSGTNPIEWYTNVLEQQGIYIHQGKQQKFKGQTYIWLEVDPVKTPIHEFTQSNELDPHDTETLAWRTFFYTCYAGTLKECLGLAVSARELSLEKGKKPLYLNTILDAILSA
jgi:hypothetical protein